MPRTVTVTQRHGTSVDAAVAGHQFTCGVPDSATDDGPTPWEFVLAGIGSCTSLTIYLYAERKGWPVDDVSITLDFDTQTREAQMDVRIKGELDAEQRARLEQVAQRCPVTRTLEQGLTVSKRFLPAA